MKYLLSVVFYGLTALVVSGCGGNDAIQGSNSGKDYPKVPSSANTMEVLDASGATRTVAITANAYTPVSTNKDQLQSAKSKSIRPNPVSIDLGQPSPELQIKATTKYDNKSLAPKAFQVGYFREVNATSSAKSTASNLRWQSTLAGGLVSAIAFNSTSAVGMRIGVLVKALPDEAIVRFYAYGSINVNEMAGKNINELLRANLKAGDSSDDAKTYWGPLLAGERGVVEIELPAGINASAVEISIPGISHVFLDPLGERALAGGVLEKSAGICNINVACETPLPPISNAVGLMNFVKQGRIFICTGTLLNDTENSGTPYFLTADHCISTQTAASTLETKFFSKADTCSATVAPSGSVKAMSQGAILLWSVTADSANAAAPRQSSTDSSFLKLIGPLPAGVMLAGWSADAQDKTAGATSNFTGIHHPDGDIQKISKGKVTSYAVLKRDFNPRTFLYDIDSFFTYNNPVVGKKIAPMYQVNWSSGITEGGSSGSGLFLDGSSANPKLVGQLYGGYSSCSVPTAPDVYGRFDIAYQERLNEWLSPNFRPVFRFYNGPSNSYFLSNSTVEKNAILDSYPQFTYEGPTFYASPAAGSNLSPVYRFRNMLNGSYLWTISDVERAAIVQNYSNVFVQENIAWYARSTFATGWVPLYRFRDQTNGTYLFTASEIEKDSIIQLYAARFVNEGIVYYVKQAL